MLHIYYMYNIKSTITEDITDTNLETEVITRNCLQTPGLPTCKITMATVQNDGISIHHSVAIIVWNELIIGEQLSHSCTNEWGQSGIIDIDCILYQTIIGTTTKNTPPILYQTL
mgnify:CR=1 FL=1